MSISQIDMLTVIDPRSNCTTKRYIWSQTVSRRTSMLIRLEVGCEITNTRSV